jgi:hypothetical protein
MGAAMRTAIPNRAQTLKLLRLMGDHAPILHLRGESDGYGERWTLHGAEVPPAIAGWLMRSGYLADRGATEMGARQLLLTPPASNFGAMVSTGGRSLARWPGCAWWSSASSG